MAPAAVQTKHSVAEKIISAPLFLKTLSMAGLGTPSLSPRRISFLPDNFPIISLSLKYGLA
jgi:hypothetical protein